MTETEKFAARFGSAFKSGLRDVKFCVAHGEAMTEEDFAREANRFDEACKQGTKLDLAALDAQLR